MYTEQQAEKAIKRKFIENADKQIAYWHHNIAVDMVNQLYLPYRVALDYTKAKQGDMEIHLNYWYPFPKMPVAAVLSKEETFNKRANELMSVDGGKGWFKSLDRDLKCTDEEYQREQAAIDEKARQKALPYRPWNLDTKQGLEQWEHYFALFIAPYESVLASWNCFNMFGNTKHSEVELKERKAFYMGVIKRFKEDKQGLYDTEPRKKQLGDYDKYDFSNIMIDGGCYMWNGKDVPKHPQALEIMKKELALFESAKKENKLHYGDNRIELIKSIIGRLEQGK